MIKRLAQISKLNISSKNEKYFQEQFSKTLAIIDEFNELDTSNTECSYNPIKSENVFREDVIKPQNVFTQDEAVSNAKRTHNGFFVSDAIKNEN